jgi:hypothetical protein
MFIREPQYKAPSEFFRPRSNSDLEQPLKASLSSEISQLGSNSREMRNGAAVVIELKRRSQLHAVCVRACSSLKLGAQLEPTKIIKEQWSGGATPRRGGDLSRLWD